MESVVLPEGIEKVDVIVSEWMGYALLYESMLPTVLYARDRYLSPSGLVLPSSCEICISASTHSRLSFWEDVYGFDMRSLTRNAIKEASIEVVPQESLISAPATLQVIDVTSISDAQLDFTAPLALNVTAAGQLCSFVIHFDTIFDYAAKGGVRTAFTTSCEAMPTHWKQTALPLKEPLAVAAGDRISGSVTFSRGLEYKRAYNISVAYEVNGSHRGLQMWTTE